MIIIAVYAVANFLYIFLARPIGNIFVIAVSLLAKIVAIVVIAVRVAMVHFTSSWFFVSLRF